MLSLDMTSQPFFCETLTTYLTFEYFIQTFFYNFFQLFPKNYSHLIFLQNQNKETSFIKYNF